MSYLEEAYGHASINLPDTDMGFWGCATCWQTGSMFPGEMPQEVECIPRSKPSDWNMVYG